MNNSTKPMLMQSEIGKCPSCHELMTLPAGIILNKRCTCPLCSAQSYAYKWLLNNKLSRGLQK